MPDAAFVPLLVTRAHHWCMAHMHTAQLVSRAICIFSFTEGEGKIRMVTIGHTFGATCDSVTKLDQVHTCTIHFTRVASVFAHTALLLVTA